MTNSFQVTALSPTFQLLQSILLLDPEDLDSDVVEETFKEALRIHDYFYQDSDDIRAYDKGRLEAHILHETIRRISTLSPIFEAYCKMKDGN